MSEDNSKAVSFTNSYCVFADGLRSGLENCLAENVVLDWFGKTIKSRSNVTAFMNTHKVNSRHVFNTISSTSNIGYNKKPNRRKAMRRSKNSNGNISIELRPSCEHTPKTPASGIVSNGDRSRSLIKNDVEENTVDENDLTCELNDDDLTKIFKLEKIQSTNIEEIEKKINQISLEDRLKLISPRKRGFKEVNGSENQETTMNYIEAYGEILFSKKSRKLSGWGEKQIVSSSITHSWRKPCTLQIAYTSRREPVRQTSPTTNNKVSSKDSPNHIGSPKLLSFDDINEISNRLVPNNNYFGGYLNDVSLKKKKENFFKNLNEHLSKNEANKLGLAPRYVNDQLVFQKNICDDTLNDVQNDFVFNHTIHVIIYEGISRCRINLSQKFI